jgi:hypothetical protein
MWFRVAKMIGKFLILVISLFALLFPLQAQEGPENRSLVLEAQDLLFAMGYPVGKPDGKFGGKTAAALNEETGLDLMEVTADTLKPLYENFVSNVLQKSTKVDWQYRAAEFTISGGRSPNVYLGLNTLDDLLNTGFNVVTYNFHCDRGYKIDNAAPEHYPLERQLGCDLAYSELDGSSKDALQVYVDEAKKRNLQINLKPMFLDLTSSGQSYGYEDGKVPVEGFLYGDLPTWDGYLPRLIKIAEYAEKNKIEYLTIGTEFGNLNREIMWSKDWPGIIAKIRNIYSGKLIYAHNLGPKYSLSDLLLLADFAKNIDFMAINFFPNNLLEGRKFYTADEVNQALVQAQFDGANLLKSLSDFSEKINKKLIMSEVSFFTWRGSFNWMFRNTCDFYNAGKKDWIFTKGPLAVKEPSIAASLVLASGWMDAFAQLPFVHGASHTFWYQTWVDIDPNDPFVLSSGVNECGKAIANNDYLKAIFRRYYLGSDG